MKKKYSGIYLIRFWSSRQFAKVASYRLVSVKSLLFFVLSSLAKLTLPNSPLLLLTMARKICLSCKVDEFFASVILFQTFSPLPSRYSSFSFLSTFPTKVTKPYCTPQTAFITLLFHHFYQVWFPTFRSVSHLIVM